MSAQNPTSTSQFRTSSRLTVIRIFSGGVAPLFHQLPLALLGPGFERAGHGAVHGHCASENDPLAHSARAHKQRAAGGPPRQWPPASGDPGGARYGPPDVRRIRQVLQEPITDA